jgi:hypothetical protein
LRVVKRLHGDHSPTLLVEDVDRKNLAIPRASDDGT